MDIENKSTVTNRLIGFSQTNSFGEQVYSNLNTSTFNHTKSSSLYKNKFSDRLFNGSNLYILIGTDSGLLPRYIRSQGAPVGSRYLFIEPKPIFDELQEEGLFLGFSDQFAFADEETWVEALKEFKLEDYFYINSVRSESAFCATEDALGLYAELSWQIVERLKQLEYQTNVSLSNREFICQQLLNTADNYLSLTVLEDTFKDKTAFVLGGGTSLDDVLPWLLVHRSQVIIIAVSRISKRLVEFGIEPDFICSVDPYLVNWEVSKEIYLFETKPIFIHSYHVSHKLLSQWPGLSYYAGDKIPWKSPLNEKTMAMPGPTVTNSAIFAAIKLGFSTIYLAGVDYCLSLDGFSHAKGSYETAAGARFNLTGLTVETYKGDSAPTRLDYLYARDSLEAQVAHYTQLYEVQLFNVASQAAKIKRVNYCSTESIELSQEPINVSDVINSNVQNKSRVLFLTQAQQEMSQAAHQLKKIKLLAQEALECNESLYNAEGYIEDYKKKLYLDRLERDLNKKYKKLTTLVKKFGIRQFLKIVKPFDDMNQLSAEELKVQLRVYYQSYIEGSKDLLQYVEKAEQHIIARLEELKESPDWDFLISYCRKEKCYGRVRIWRNLESAKQLDQKYIKIFQEFEHLFVQEIEKTPQFSETVKQETSLSFLKSRAQILFKHQQKQLLQHLLFALDKHHDPDGVIPYRYLIQGYLAELEKDNEQAAEAYSKVFDVGNGPVEEALLRVVSLKLEGQEELAHQALTCLAQLKDPYLVFYADSCRIRGDISDAIDAYILYIEKFPQDILAQLKLARLYINQNINEGAHLMLDMILEGDPDNETALGMKKELKSRAS